MTGIEQIALGFELMNLLNTVSRVHGPKWPQVVRDTEPFLRDAQRRTGAGTSILAAAISLAKQARSDGKVYASLEILAVGAELSKTEPA